MWLSVLIPDGRSNGAKALHGPSRTARNHERLATPRSGCAHRDPELLNRATELGRVLFTQDDDLLTEATQRQRQGQTFSGVIYAHQLRTSIGDCVRDLELIVGVGEPEDMTWQTLFLPL